MPRTMRVLHRTEYSYDRKVTLNPHRLMLRPRDGHDLWVEKAYLRITPNADLRWYFDTFGNSVAEATFLADSDKLVIESELLLRRYVAGMRAMPTASHVCDYPFAYSEGDARDLSPYLGLENAQDAQAIDDWLAQHFTDRPAGAFRLLEALSAAVNHAFGYSRRDEMGTQSAGETIAQGQGTCRDFAFFFMEAARRLGFAARFVTGYLNDTSSGDASALGGGATHAWADVFVPGEGWIEFDPTNRITAGTALIRVATTRTPAQASPISGSFVGAGAVCLGLTVSVDVSEVAETV